MRISDWSSDVCSSDLAWAWLWPRVPLLVYPAPEAHGPPLPEGSGDNAQARLHPAGDDVHHLRTYRRGEIQTAVEEAEAFGRYVCAHAYSAEAIDRAVSNGVRTIEHGNPIDDARAELEGSGQ